MLIKEYHSCMSHDRNARKFEDTKLVIKTVNQRTGDAMAE
jgi:hypothetical protein